MTIGKDKPHGIRSNWFNPFDFDVPLAGLQHFLPGAMTTCLSRRGESPQKLAPQLVPLAALVAKLEDARFLMQSDVRRYRRIPFDASHRNLQ